MPHRYTCESSCHLHDIYIFQKNDISLITKQACGELDSSDRQNQSIASMVQNRAVGSIFSTGERCRINNSLLPNKMDQIDKYGDKVYCCSYSKDGKYLLTAGQGKVALSNAHGARFLTQSRK